MYYTIRLWYRFHLPPPSPPSPPPLPPLNFTCSQILSPWWGDIVDSGKGLLHRPPGYTHRLVSRYDNPMPESTISPPSGTKNLASGPSRQYILCRYRIEYRPVASHLIQSEHLTAEYISIYKNCKRHFRQVIFLTCSMYAEEKGLCSTVLSWLVFDVVNMLIAAIFHVFM